MTDDTPIIPLILLQRSNLSYTNPNWANRELDVIEQLSRLFQEHIWQLSFHRSDPWYIDFNVDLGFNHSALELFEDVVGRPRVGRDDDGAATTAPSAPSSTGEREEPAKKAARVRKALTMPVDIFQPREPASRLSGYCCILWYYHVVPERLYVRWEVADDDTLEDGRRVVIAKAPLPDPPPPPSSLPDHSGAGAGAGSGSAAASIREGEVEIMENHPVSPPSTGSGDSGTPNPAAGAASNHWCWNRRTSLRSKETSLSLANIALVLGWKGEFGEQMKTVIYDWVVPKSQAETKTPVPWLQKEALECRRQEEFDKIKEFFTNYIKRRTRQVNWQALYWRSVYSDLKSLTTPERLKKARAGEIYDWIQSLEDLMSKHFRTSSLALHDAGPTGTGVLLVGAETEAGPVSPVDNDSTAAAVAVDNNHTSAVVAADGVFVMPSSPQDIWPYRGGPGADEPSFKSGVLEIFEQEDQVKRRKHDGRIIEMFQEAHTFIEGEQRRLALEILHLRDQQVKKWESDIYSLTPSGGRRPLTAGR